MGLDMYLEVSKYVGGWDHSTDEEKSTFKQIIKAVGVEKLVSPASPGINIRVNVAYWRKANAVHSWFVRELAKGVDECQDIYVSIEDMENLIAECKAALELYAVGDIQAAGERMQPQAGFFFGTTEVDKWWAEGLKDTIKQLTPLVDLGEKFEFYYRASW